MAQGNVPALRQNLSNGANRRQIQDRVEWIDALRALAMVLVIYGHQVPDLT